MKRVGHLWETITSFDNLLAAAHESARGKRFSPQVASFHFSLERELFQIQRDLLAGVINLDHTTNSTFSSRSKD